MINRFSFFEIIKSVLQAKILKKSFVKERSLTPVLPSAILASEIKKSEFKIYIPKEYEG